MKGRIPHLPIAILVACIGALYPLQRWIDVHSRGLMVERETLYFSSGESVRRVALGYESLLADLYWMRAVQYFGKKVLDNPSMLDERKAGSLDLLYTLIDVTTTLDPQFIQAYRFGGLFVHDYDDQVKGYVLLEKGIRNNPTYPYLYQDLAYVYWTDGRCEDASRTYLEASKLPGAPSWMGPLAAHVLSDCGNREFAKQMLERMYESTDDENVRLDIERKLKSYQALDEIELLGGAIAAYTQRTGQFPSSLPQLMRVVQFPKLPNVPAIRVNPGGEPLDPNGVPYLYDPATGAVTTDRASMKLPRPIAPVSRAKG